MAMRKSAPTATLTHGGPDAAGAARWDFSTNANACGPWSTALTAVRGVDAARYPDPSYTTLRARLAQRHGVGPERVLIAASASEAIWRVTAWSARRGGRRVWMPSPGYGEYAAAAANWGLARAGQPDEADAVWLCDPGSPLGAEEADAHVCAARRAAEAGAAVVVDLAYDPLRLSGQRFTARWGADWLWQLWSPNKALGLTGVRGAYLIAPPGAEPMVAEWQTLAPSWPVGSHGVAMLEAWCDPTCEPWLQACRTTLAQWRDALAERLRGLGWAVRPSVVPFFVARPPQPIDAHALRAHGVKLRDATSFGLPGWWRLSAQPPAAVDALERALRAVAAEAGRGA
jgi:histidinol-phosphate aminotransferase